MKSFGLAVFFVGILKMFYSNYLIDKGQSRCYVFDHFENLSLNNLFHLSCQIYWNRVIHNSSLFTFNVHRSYITNCCFVSLFSFLYQTRQSLVSVNDLFKETALIDVLYNWSVFYFIYLFFIVSFFLLTLCSVCIYFSSFLNRMLRKIILSFSSFLIQIF